MLSNADRIIEAVSSIRLMNVEQESDIHKLVEDGFITNNIDYIHEARLPNGRRVDFLVGETAVEIKKSKPVRSALIKQISAYLSNEMINDIVVISRQNISLPKAIMGKKVSFISLDRLWGVSLP